MHHKDRAGSWSEDRLYRIGTDVLRIAIDIRKDGPGAAHHNTACGSNESSTAGDDVIAPNHSKRA
jgi:hypothetical protein